MQKMKMNKYIYILILSLLIFSCDYKFNIKTLPEDAVIIINGEKISNDHVYVTNQKHIDVLCTRRGYKDYHKICKKNIPIWVKRIKIKMDIDTYSIEIETVEGKSDIVLNSKKIGTTPCELKFDYGIYNLTLLRTGCADQEVRLEAKRNGKILFRHQKKTIPINQIGIFKCGSLPKQVIFSFDNNYIFIPLLNGYGFEVFNMNTLLIDNYIVVDDEHKTKGFPEGLFIKEKDVFFVSQMCTGKIYEYSYPELKYLRTIETDGILSKFMAWSPMLQLVAISNWISNDVSIIEYSTGKVIQKIKTSAAPRGVVFSKDGKYLYVTTFDGGMVHKINTKKWKEEKFIYKEYAAMRHIVLTNDDSIAYVSNMCHKEIYEIDMKRFVITHTYKVDYNPNTISLTPNNRYLYVSCRGPNDKVSYLRRSPRKGNITIIDLIKKEVISFVKAGNQPTGLDISKDGNYLCFSNFRDNNIEIYWIGNVKN
ncbi:MAG: YncE family protein [Spirochaetes bacterium]|nr:YncE family protein [Spirochaetota bacterium]